MLFVNRIAYILHGIVAHYNGTANKNIGDAFLLTWKLDEKQTEEVQRALADQALLSFLRTLIEINRYKNFVCDFSKPAADRLRSRFEGGPYQVKMGFGLHVGWAIEGAIGSKRKIDASYISPHVNMTEFLESSTKQYGKACERQTAAAWVVIANVRRLFCVINRVYHSHVGAVLPAAHR